MGSDVTSQDFDPDEALVLDDQRYAPGNVAVVTGAASGIGRAVACCLATNGLTVLATDVDEDGLAATADRAETAGADGPVHTFVADLTDDDAPAAIADAAADLGTVTYLANVAGLQHVAPIEEFPVEQYDLMHDVMLRAPLLLAKECIPHMRERDDEFGCVGNMASVHGRYVTSDKVAYNTLKFGLRGLTQSIAAEGDGTLRAFSVSTGYVSTPLVTGQIPDTAEQRGITEEAVVEEVMLGQSRVKEMMTPTEVANLFAFGFSKHGKHLDGGDLLFDGGMTLTYE